MYGIVDAIIVAGDLIRETEGAVAVTVRAWGRSNDAKKPPFVVTLKARRANDKSKTITYTVTED